MHSQPSGSYAPQAPSYTAPRASSSIDDRFTPARDYSGDTAARAPQHVGPTYTIRPNDSFYSISETVYGSGSYFKALEEHNRENVPYSDRMRVGDKIETPSVAELEKQYPDLVPRRRNAAVAKTTLGAGVMTNASLHVPPGAKVYKVQQGDTLFDIARNELGKATRWAEIYDLNRDRLGDDFDFVAPGTELLIPENRSGASSAPLTTQSRQPYTR
jgi:nucleoid-associated protein YgaU